jgi:hypothetical protein
MARTLLTLELWNESMKKWNKIFKLTRNRTRFISNRGFEEIDILDACGFCRAYQGETFSNNTCKECPLFKRRICYYQFGSTEYLFWQYMKKMCEIRNANTQRSIANRWKEALDLATQIRDAIKALKPN